MADLTTPRDGNALSIRSAATNVEVLAITRPAAEVQRSAGFAHHILIVTIFALTIIRTGPTPSVPHVEDIILLGLTISVRCFDNIFGSCKPVRGEVQVG
jgi:hypothetical protein